MSDSTEQPASKLQDLILEIAKKHGVLLNKNDPIIILETLHTRFLADNLVAHKNLLAEHESRLELVSKRWAGDINSKAEHVINASLTAHHEMISKMMLDNTKAVSDMIEKTTKVLQDNRTKNYKLAHGVAIMNLVASVLTLAGIVLYGMFLSGTISI